MPLGLKSQKSKFIILIFQKFKKLPELFENFKSRYFQYGGWVVRWDLWISDLYCSKDDKVQDAKPFPSNRGRKIKKKLKNLDIFIFFFPTYCFILYILFSIIDLLNSNETDQVRNQF